MSLYIRYGSSIGSGQGGGGGGVTSIAPMGSTPNSAGGDITGSILTLEPADGSFPGLLTAAAQTIGGVKNFNANIFAANLSGTNSGDVTIGTANGLSLIGQALSLGLSSTSTTGALSSTDWNTFNNKQSTLTLGNLTDVGTDGITITGGTGAIVGSGTSISQHIADTTHNGYLSSTDWSTFNGKQAAGNYITALTGDVTAAGPGSVAATIAANAVTNTKLAQMPTLTIKGNNTGGTANAADLTVVQVNAILPVFSSTLNGLVPLSGGGTTNFLRADGTFAVPPGATSGTVTTVSVVSANGLAGTVATATSTPAITLSTTITGILQGNGTAISAASTTGSGAVVLATSPTLVTPALGTPTALVGTNITGTAAGLTAGTVTTNANLTGDVTSSGNATTLATVNSNVGSFTNANITVNAKGLITAASNGSGGSAIRSQIMTITGNGYGSTNISVRRWVTPTISTGSDITYTDSATLGTKFTAVTTGLYAISYTDFFGSTAARMGFTINGTQGGTSIQSITDGSIRAFGQTTSGGRCCVAWTGLLTAGDFVWCQTDQSPPTEAANGNGNIFTIVKIGA